MKPPGWVGNITYPDGRYCDFQFSGIYIIRTGGTPHRVCATRRNISPGPRGVEHLETTLYVLREYLYRLGERAGDRPILFPSKVGLATAEDPIEYAESNPPGDRGSPFFKKPPGRRGIFSFRRRSSVWIYWRER